MDLREVMKGLVLGGNAVWSVPEKNEKNVYFGLPSKRIGSSGEAFFKNYHYYYFYTF